MENIKKYFVDNKLKNNLDTIKNITNYDKSYDIKIREFNILFLNKTISGFLVFVEGLVDKNIINNDILKNITNNNFLNINMNNDIEKYL
ncbi:MAG: hypothetical protein RSF67_02045, partial [Clostridia bacterium]